MDTGGVQEGEIVGKPTLLAKYEGLKNAKQILDSLGRAGYPVEDVSVLFKVHGTDQVIDLITGDVAAGQALPSGHARPEDLQNGQTAVLLHPNTGQLQAVKQALAEIGEAEIEYAGETHAYGRPGGVERHDEQLPDATQ